MAASLLLPLSEAQVVASFPAPVIHWSHGEYRGGGDGTVGRRGRWCSNILYSSSPTLVKSGTIRTIASFLGMQERTNLLIQMFLNPCPLT